MKRSSDAKPLKGVIKDIIRIFGLEGQLREVKSAEIWAKVVGPYAAKRTLSVRLIKGVLLVNLDSAALKQEYQLCKAQLISRFNEEAEDINLTDIEFR